MIFNSVTSLVSLLAVAGAAMPQSKRATSSDEKIYAYGTGISGLPVYADASGVAYISESPASNLSNVTMTITAGTAPWNATLTPNNATSSTSGHKFYIITTSDTYSPVGFVEPSGTAPSGAETTGFTLYGSDIMFISGTTYLSQFWAKTTDVDGVWGLMWNANGTSQSDSVPVVLKTTAPTPVDLES